MITQPYNLNLIPGGVPVRVPVSQYDAGSRDITFALYHGGTAFAVPAGAVVTCDGAKPDRKGFSCLATASGSTVTVTVTEQMTAVAGEVDCQITIRKDGQVLGSANFYLVVERAALPDEADISKTEINAFTQIANQAADAAQSAQEAVDTLDGKKAALDASTAAADAARTQLVSATDAGNTARTNLVNATNAGNTARTNLQTATTAATNAKDALTQPTADAQAAKTALDAANNAAEENLSQLNNSNAMAQKIPKVSPAVAGNLAVLKADGTLSDSGKKPGDFAPSGYGLGIGAYSGEIFTTAAQVDTAVHNGWYQFVGASGEYISTFGYCGILVIANAFGVTQNAYTSAKNYGGLTIARRSLRDGVWGEWEFENPPMLLGVEYRTTERWQGKPVYIKVVDCGLTVSGNKSVSFTLSGLSHICGFEAFTPNYSLPWINIGNDAWSIYANLTANAGGACAIDVWAGANRVGQHVYAVVRYTK